MYGEGAVGCRTELEYFMQCEAMDPKLQYTVGIVQESNIYILIVDMIGTLRRIHFSLDKIARYFVPSATQSAELWFSYGHPSLY